jgi:hypothetical protein
MNAGTIIPVDQPVRSHVDVAGTAVPVAAGAPRG